MTRSCQAVLPRALPGRGRSDMPKVTGALVLTATVLALAATDLASADTLTITATPATALAGTTVKISFLPKLGAAGDTVTLSFGDGAQATVTWTWTCGMLGGCNQAQHAYAGAGTYTVTGTGTIGSTTVSGTTQVVITAEPGPAEQFVATAAHQGGFSETVWRTDLEIHNPGEEAVTYQVALLKTEQDNASPTSHEFPLAGGRSAHHGDVLASVFGFAGAGALRVRSGSPALMVVSRTYNQLARGTYGQLVPALGRTAAITHLRHGRLIGISEAASLAEGFRTNLGLLSLSPAPITVEVGYHSRVGTLMKLVTYDLRPYEHLQVNRAFHTVTPDAIEQGFLTVRSTTVGGALLAYASMVDNVTGDPVYIPAMLDEPQPAP